MNQDPAWRDIASRTTKTHKDAKTHLNEYLKDADFELSIAQMHLDTVIKAKHAAWARANPEEAKLQELEDRTAAAEFAARSAEFNAQQAIDSANRAKIEAENNAQWQQKRAAEAERKEKDSNRKADRAEDALNQHGIYSY